MVLPVPCCAAPSAWVGGGSGSSGRLDQCRGFTLKWQTTYNAGAKPISIRLRRKYIQELVLRPLLGASNERPSQGQRCHGSQARHLGT